MPKYRLVKRLPDLWCEVEAPTARRALTLAEQFPEDAWHVTGLPSTSAHILREKDADIDEHDICVTGMCVQDATCARDLHCERHCECPEEKGD